MYNELFSIGPFTVHMYGLMIAIGVIAVYVTAERRAKKKGLNSDKIFDLVIWCLIFGFLGSKILYCLTTLPSIIADPMSVIRNFGDGWVVYGGILGGILGAYLFCRKNKLEMWKYFDIGLPSVALAQGIGRIGCFFAGCCYGKETSLPIGIVFPEGSFAPAGVPLLPTQLFSSAGDFVIAFVLVRMTGKMRHTGDVGALYLMLYGIGRFCVEFLRTNEQGGFIGLTTAQLISIVFMIISIVLFIRNKRAADREDLMYI